MAQGYCRGLDKMAQDRKATTKASMATLAEDTPEAEEMAQQLRRHFDTYRAIFYNFYELSGDMRHRSGGSARCQPI